MKIPLPIHGAQRHQEPVVVGIDLGTTNSLVAWMDGGESRVIPGPDGDPLLPSVVYFPPEGPPVVGKEALPFLTSAPERTVYSVKRLMGLGSADLVTAGEGLHYRLDGGHPEVLRVRIGDRVYSPSEVSALILRELKARAEAHLGREVTQAVITVPAYFNYGQRQATRDAGRIAGLDVLRIVNEPTAACLAYGLERRREGLMAVYDLGGGTFDISLLKLTQGIFEVLSTNGDTRLGGDDFDQAIVDWFLEALAAEAPRALPLRPETAARLRGAVLRAKHRLSEGEEAEVALDLPDGTRVARTLTRLRFEELAAPVLERTLGPCRRALDDAGLDPARIDEVVLVGGATRTPLVRRKVEELFGRRPHCELNPDEVVALGAGVQAGILSGQVQGLLLLDVNPLSLGLETYGGAVEKLIPRNTTIPTSARNVFTTSVDGQTAFDLHIVQGERELAADCRSLARFQIHIPPMPAGWPRLEVTFLVDENGILQVSAYEHRSQSEAQIEIRPSYGLTEDEVERMVLESFEHAEEDLERRRLVEARVEGDQVLRATEKQLPLGEEFVSEGALAPAELQRIRDAAAALQAALAGDDAAAIRVRTEDLDAASRGLAALVMDRAVRHALEGRRVDEAASSSETQSG